MELFLEFPYFYEGSVVLSICDSSSTKAIKYDSSFQLMKRLCDYTSPFWAGLHSSRIRGAFSGEGITEMGKDLRLQWY